MRAFVSPVTGTWAAKVTSPFGAGRDGGFRKHAGNDLQAANGSPAVAATGGRVVYAGHNQGYQWNAVVVDAEGNAYRYATHGPLSVKVGQIVEPGQKIGSIARGHLHFEVIPAGTKTAKAMAANPGVFISTKWPSKGQAVTVDPASFFGIEKGAQVVGGKPIGNPQLAALVPEEAPADPFGVSAMQAANAMATGAPTPSRPLKLTGKPGKGRMTGEDVRQLQETLAQAGHFKGEVDGVFGPQTKKAVQSYQLANNLKPDGIVGARTQTALAGITSAGNIASVQRLAPTLGESATPEASPIDIAMGRIPSPTVALGARTGAEGSPELAGQRPRAREAPGAPVLTASLATPVPAAAARSIADDTALESAMGPATRSIRDGRPAPRVENWRSSPPVSAQAAAPLYSVPAELQTTDVRAMPVSASPTAISGPDYAALPAYGDFGAPVPPTPALPPAEGPVRRTREVRLPESFSVPDETAAAEDVAPLSIAGTARGEAFGGAPPVGAIPDETWGFKPLEPAWQEYDDVLSGDKRGTPFFNPFAGDRTGARVAREMPLPRTRPTSPDTFGPEMARLQRLAQPLDESFPASSAGPKPSVDFPADTSVGDEPSTIAGLQNLTAMTGGAGQLAANMGGGTLPGEYGPEDRNNPFRGLSWENLRRNIGDLFGADQPATAAPKSVGPQSLLMGVGGNGALPGGPAGDTLGSNWTWGLPASVDSQRRESDQWNSAFGSWLDAMNERERQMDWLAGMNRISLRDKPGFWDQRESTFVEDRRRELPPADPLSAGMMQGREPEGGDFFDAEQLLPASPRPDIFGSAGNDTMMGAGALDTFGGAAQAAKGASSMPWNDPITDHFGYMRQVMERAMPTAESVPLSLRALDRGSDPQMLDMWNDTISGSASDDFLKGSGGPIYATEPTWQSTLGFPGGRNSLDWGQNRVASVAPASVTPAGGEPANDFTYRNGFAIGGSVKDMTRPDPNARFDMSAGLPAPPRSVSIEGSAPDRAKQALQSAAEARSSMPEGYGKGGGYGGGYQGSSSGYSAGSGSNPYYAGGFNTTVGAPWTSPNFGLGKGGVAMPNSGGSIYPYSYNPQTGQGQYVDEHGNVHSYTSF